MDGIRQTFRDDEGSTDYSEETRSRLRVVEERLSLLEDSVKTAVEAMVPKVDALLAERRDDKLSHSSATTSTSNTVQSTSLLDLAERGDYEQILSLFTQPQTSSQIVHQRTDAGDTVLHVAANRGDLKTTIVLLGSGAKVNASGHKLRSPLHCAAVHGHLDIVQRLLDAGAKVDAKDSDGATALDLMAGIGNTDMVLLLLRKGARPSEKSVFLAAAQDRWNLAELFLQNGVPVQACDSKGDSLVVYSAKARRWDMVEMLLEKGASATACKDPEHSALVIAAREAQVDIVRLLLRKGASSNAIQVKKALMEARSALVVWTFFEIIPDTVKRNAGVSALVNAGREGRLEILVSLLEIGVDIASTETDYTALHAAACYGRTECVKELLRRGAAHDVKDTNGDTPLHDAAEGGKVECVRVLVEAGANVGEKNEKGKTPADMTNSEIIRSILRGL